MELELGLKLTRAADEFTSDIQLAKDRAGPVFLSRETDAMFVLTAYLKGYKRRNIKIDINEDGSLIGISGEKQVIETVMVGWKLYKKDAEVKVFKKVYKIPDGVILDKIEAKFNDDESTLTITMPKKVKGIRGAAIEEVKEKQELDKEGSGSLPIVDEKSPETGASDKEKDNKMKAKIGEDDKADEMPAKGGKQTPKEEIRDEKRVAEYSCRKEVRFLGDGEEKKPISPPVHGEAPRLEAGMPKEDAGNQKNADDIQERAEHLGKQDQQEANNHVSKKENDVHEEEGLQKPAAEESAVAPAEGAAEAEPGKLEDGGDKPREKRCKMCIPIVAGSTLLLSLVVFVIQIIRSKNQTSRRRD